MRLFCRVEGGNAHWRLHRLPVATAGAEPQEGGRIARAWIEDPHVYPVYQCPNDGAGCPRGQWWLQMAILLKFWSFFYCTCQALLADLLGQFWYGSTIW